MKKKYFVMISVIVALVLSVVAYVYIWGGRPEIENFAEVSEAYETVAKLALNTYSEISPEEEYIVIYIYDGNFQYNKINLPLTEDQQNAVQTASKAFEGLRVCKNAVFFHEDETGYYGLVYSEEPLSALNATNLLQQGRRYHRINRHWYEWGVWGI